MTPVPAGWDAAPVGLLHLRADGTVLAANPTLLEWTGLPAESVVGRRLPELLSVGGRIYWETHLGPLLHVERRVDEVALELRGHEGRLPVLLSAVAGDDGTITAALSSARERNRYERELLAARTAAEHSEAQVRALQAATAALSQAVGVDAVAGALLGAAVGPLGAAAATVWLVADDDRLVVHGSSGPPAEPPSGVLLHGRQAVADGPRVVVPLHGQRALHGALSVAPRPGAGADPLDVEVLTAVGQQAGLALDRATLYEQSADVAVRLQRALLAADPPEDPRFGVATVYRPGIATLEVGGDWHDVFLASPGQLALAVGDVVGRGLVAATAMGQLRSAVRAVTGDDVEPAAVLARLDRFVEQTEAAGMATLAYAELDLADGRLRYACAGHPPPVLLPADGPPRVLWEGRSTPLGSFVAGARGQAEVVLQPGDRVLLYTDGLVERRDRTLQEGLAALTAVAAGLAAQPLDDAVRGLTRELLRDEDSRDDVCVLLLTWAGRDFERHLSADLTGLSETRRELAAWLGARGVGPQARADLVLAASEALANAAEHGSGLLPSARVSVRVRLEERPDGAEDVVVHVRDRGSWRGARTPSPERGRGLSIISALVDDVLVEAGEGTTVVLRRRAEVAS